jgi:uncharacterized membrane protein
MSLRPLWRHHPHVRSGRELPFRERAAEVLKHWFGTWTFLFVINGLFFGWIIINVATGGTIDPGLFYANLCLSWLAGQQGGALQIAANRGDRVASEVAMSDLQSDQRSEARIEELHAKVDALTAALATTH